MVDPSKSNNSSQNVALRGLVGRWLLFLFLNIMVVKLQGPCRTARTGVWNVSVSSLLNFTKETDTEMIVEV
jgi:hypothetical protein